MQENHVVCYDPRKLKDNENNYATTELELASIVHTLKMWRHYLLFKFRTNHHGLKYFFEQLTLNARQSRLTEFLCEFDFEIKHIKGKENKVVDALSRKLHAMHVAAISNC